ncbi:MAG TPA: MlaD family protein [Gemmataceae bacterium]|nr:MlaD family protein [Gemmataceae bacterium]
MTRHLSRLQGLALGLVVVAGLSLGLFGLFAVASRNGLDRSAFAVRARFADIGGVEVGTRVRLQGIDAGEVEAVVPPAIAGDKVLLQLRVAGRLRHLVGADARVQIASETLLNGKIVRILPGSPQTPPVADDAELASLPTTELADGIAQATARMNGLLAKFEVTLDGVQKGEGTLGQLVKNDGLYKDLSTTLADVRGALRELRSGEGTFGKLVRNNEVYDEALSSLQDVRKMVNSVKQNSDAIKSLPVVRNYVVDPNKELIRPDCKRYRKWFPEDKLFEPGKAVLTSDGKKRLDDASAWLNEAKDSAQDVVIAGFAGPNLNPDFALALTQKQSEAVMEYLKSNYRVHRTGFWFWSNRSVRCIGVGNNPPPVPETETLPAARIELLVFVPQG